jgi:predicted site-specific integrase-resolvase
MPIKIENVALYSVSEVSQIMGVTTVSIRNYINQGYLKGQKILGRWVVLEKELSDFLTNPHDM